MSSGRHVQHNHSSEPHEEVEEAEPWLVSYADMMTLLFGFFVLMYTFASSKLDDTSDNWIKVKKELAAFFGGQDSAIKTDKLMGDSNELFSPNVGIDIGGQSGSRRDTRGFFEDRKSESEKKDEQESDNGKKDSFIGGTFVSPGTGLNNSEVKNILDIKKVMDSDKAVELIVRGSSLFKGTGAELSNNGRIVIGKLCERMGSIQFPFFLSITAFAQSENTSEVNVTDDKNRAVGKPTAQTIVRAQSVMQEISKCPDTLNKALNLSAVGVGYIPSGRVLKGVMEDGVIFRINVATDF